MASEKLLRKKGDGWQSMRMAVEIVAGEDDVNVKPKVDQVGEGCLKTPPQIKSAKKK